MLGFRFALRLTRAHRVYAQAATATGSRAVAQYGARACRRKRRATIWKCSGPLESASSGPKYAVCKAGRNASVLEPQPTAFITRCDAHLSRQRRKYSGFCIESDCDRKSLVASVIKNSPSWREHCKLGICHQVACWALQSCLADLRSPNPPGHVRLPSKTVKLYSGRPQGPSVTDGSRSPQIRIAWSTLHIRSRRSWRSDEITTTFSGTVP